MTAQMNQFMTDEYVLAYHGPLLYEARVRFHPTSAGTIDARPPISPRHVLDVMLPSDIYSPDSAS